MDKWLYRLKEKDNLQKRLLLVCIIPDLIMSLNKSIDNWG